MRLIFFCSLLWYLYRLCTFDVNKTILTRSKWIVFMFFGLSISLKVIENLTKGRIVFQETFFSSLISVFYLVIVLPFVSRHYYYRFVPEIQNFDKSRCAAMQPAEPPLHNINICVCNKNMKSQIKCKNIFAN